MDFQIVEIFKRSITIERENNERYESSEAAEIYLRELNSVGRNKQAAEKPYLVSRLNVISIDGLTPDTEYELRMEPGGAVQRFTTQHESFLLNVRSFGAVGDGTHNDTTAIQAAIAACPADGTVYLPKGTYYSGPIFLKSSMSLWLDEGAVLLGDAERSHYPIMPGIVRNLYDNEKELDLASWEGNPLDCFASLVSAIGCEDLDIFGRGTIDGNAQNSDWWKEAKKKRGAWRPKLVSINHSKRVRMQSVTVQNSPCWTIHPYYSEELRFLSLSINNPSDSPNTDGFDPESCEDVLLLGSRISVGDDCIAIKSGKLYMASYHHKETKNVRVRNCRLERGHGSVTVGSEVAGGVRDVHVSRCLFVGTDRGVRIKTRRGRGERSVLTDLHFENISMDGVHMPVTVNMFYFCDPDGHSAYVQDRSAAPVDYRTPKIGKLTIENVDCTGVDASLLCAYGLPEAPIEEIVLKNIRAEYLPECERTPQRPVMMDHFEPVSGRGLITENVAKLKLSNVKLHGSIEDEQSVE